MFSAPPEITADVFASLPEEFRNKQKISAWLERKGRGPTHSFIEGPSFDRDGNLYIVDIAFSRIFRVSPQGAFSLVVEYDGEPNGLKIHPDGTIYVTDNQKGIIRVNPRNGAIETVVGRPGERPFLGPNDLVFGSGGDLFFTDQGETGLHDPTGCLYRLRTDGRLDRILSNAPSPNGLVLDGKESAVILAVTRDNAIWRVPFRADGTAYKVGRFIQLSGSHGSGPDGLAIDEDENLAVAHAGLGTVWLFSHLGEPMLRIRSPEGLLTTNVAFGGPDRRTLFITESQTGTILKAPVPVPGRIMYSHT